MWILKFLAKIIKNVPKSEKNQDSNNPFVFKKSNIPPKFAKLVQKKPNMFQVIFSGSLNNFGSFCTVFWNLGRILGFFEL